jgi:hypothetical protein
LSEWWIAINVSKSTAIDFARAGRRFIQSRPVTHSNAFRLLWLRFSVIFLSCKANARVYDTKSGHGPHSTPQARRLHLSAWQKSLLRLSQSGLRTQTANQPKFIPSIIVCHLRTSLLQNQ